jgi:hypothetical protein
VTGRRIASVGTRPIIQRIGLALTSVTRLGIDEITARFGNEE